MFEELYIIDGSKRLKVDLSIPSGITLSFQSNIFGDLSKITCSHTYTFKLPLTANNRRVFDNADDIRCVSNKIRRRLKAEYVQNGIPLFSNANLYIESTEACFNAIMTWGVIEGFQTLKDNDISIRKLNLSARPVFGPCNAKIDEYSNTADFVQPLYNAGLPYISTNGHKGWGAGCNSFFPLPAIPVYRLIELINSQFGTKFNLGMPYEYGAESSNHKIVSLGVIPCVSATQTADMSEKNKYQSYLGIFLADEYYGVNHVLVGPTNETCNNPLFTIYRDTSTGQSVSLKVNSNAAVKMTVDGRITMRLCCYWNAYDGQGASWITDQEMLVSAPKGKPNVYKKITPKLHIYALKEGGGVESLASIEGVYHGVEYSLGSGGLLCWDFNFSKDYGRNRLEITAPPNSRLFVALDTEDAPRLEMHDHCGWRAITFYPTMDVSCIKWNELEDKAGSFEIDLISNLPDISCMTLMKAIFFMLGAFPTINTAGEIVPAYYTALKENVVAGNAVDWSHKITSVYSALPSRTIYKVSGFGQRNYYIMKNDDVDGKGEEDDTDVYASGIGIIYVGNEVIEKNKTIIQLPFYAPYIKNKKDPFRDTGNTIKFWYIENDEVKTKEAKPCFGMIKPLVQKSGGNPTGVEWMGMEVWNGFATIASDESYAYLSKIMENPIVIEEKLHLNEHDLRNIDYSVPVYLAKYGAYFAIVSITRDSKGISKCELLKLPEEE